MLHDYKLGLRMLRKFPGLTLAGGLALAIAIAIGAGFYQVIGEVLDPAIPLPEGDRLVLIETQNVQTNATEPRVARDFLEWRRELRSIDDLGAFRTTMRNFIAVNESPVQIRVAEVTAAAFRTARVAPLLGRGFLDADESAGAPAVFVIGYGVWQRTLGGRRDVIGSSVKIGDTFGMIVGVMPESFAYPMNHQAWTPLPLRASYDALGGGAIGVVGRLRPGVTRSQADAELRVLGERAAAASPATHEHLRARVRRFGDPTEGDVEISDIAQLALTNLPALLVLIVACMNVGTLVYARTATREGEIAVRTALGASRRRIVGQLFVETLLLTLIAAAAGLFAADRALKWGVESAFADDGGAPFWMTRGLTLTTILYAGLLAVVSAALLSFLPALRVTGARLQPHLANLGSGSATLRFGRIWTGAMVAQIALTAMGIPAAIEGASEQMRNLRIRAAFPARDYLAARLDLDRAFDGETPSAFDERRARTLVALEHRLLREPGVVAVAFADWVPGTTPSARVAQVEPPSGAGAAFADSLATAATGPGFFEAFDRAIVAGRAFHGGDRTPGAEAIVVNEAFARDFLRRAGASPLGTRLRYAESAAQPPAAAKSFEIVGVVRDLGLDPDDEGNERPYVFHAASPGTVSRTVLNVRMRDNPATLVARLPLIAAEVDPRLSVQDARPLDEWIRQGSVYVTVAAMAAMSVLVLFLSALGLFSLMSVSVSRRTREIGLRTALGASRRQVIAGIARRSMAVMGGGIAIGGVVLLWGAALAGPTGQPVNDVAIFAVWLAMTSVVMLAAGVLACVVPARRALRINPIDALREA